MFTSAPSLEMTGEVSSLLPVLLNASTSDIAL